MSVHAMGKLWSAIVIASAIVLAPVSSAAQDNIRNSRDNLQEAPREYSSQIWQQTLLTTTNCESTINDSFSAGMYCMLGGALDVMLREGTHLANTQGRQVFGKHFSVVSKLSFARVETKGGLVGDLDVVFPLAGADSESSGRLKGSALFFQQGVTRWWDDVGDVRHDVRYGLVQRFRLASKPDSDVLGLAAFYLQNAEVGHEVLALGIDYIGKWGSGSFRYFHPTTSWRGVERRYGYEERALQSLELGTRLDLTTTLNFNATGYRSQAEDGSGSWVSGARIGIDWRPHPWLTFSTNQRYSENKPTSTYYFNISVPLGESSAPLPKWRGLGTTAGGAAPGSSAMWNPVSDIGQIRIATRTTSSSQSGGISIRFLQDSVDSGGVVRLEVELPAAATTDTRVSVSLVPGNGDNPAVAGVDFVDQAVEATIPNGETTTQVSIPLLQNDGLQETRSLSATVSLL